jgi:prepilin-type N-terminal cleavage/methylation domain-containing protein
MRVRAKKQGFTLLEVLVAMAILGIGLIVIIELFSGGLRLGRTAEEYTRAVGYARMKLEEISLAKTLEEGIEEGEFDREYRWQVEVKKVDLIPPGRETSYQPPVALYWVRIEVLWKSGIRERTTALESYRILKAEENEQRV